MSLLRARIVTPWAGDGISLQTSFRPNVFVDHPLGAGEQAVDVTGQPEASIVPSPNAYTVEAILDNTKLAAIEADANYGPGAVLWSEAYPG
jgi:hypothetical protein